MEFVHLGELAREMEAHIDDEESLISLMEELEREWLKVQKIIRK